MCFVWISEQTATFALCMSNRWVFIIDVFIARYGLSPYITQIHFVLEGLKFQYLDIKYCDID